MKTRLKLIAIICAITFAVSCSKDNNTSNHIQGLWIGTYIAAENGNNPYFFSFSIYPDGSLSYKSLALGNTSYYANGNWSLDGTTFSFSVVETKSGNTQTGWATYNSSNGTLTSGIISDPTSRATWKMDRVN